jgi:hypothetical protein
MREDLERLIEEAAKARGCVDSDFLRFWNEKGRKAERFCDGATLMHWSEAVMAPEAKHGTALACAIEAADVFIPSCSVGGIGQRAIGALREGLKSALYARFVDAQKRGEFRIPVSL